MSIHALSWALTVDLPSTRSFERLVLIYLADWADAHAMVAGWDGRPSLALVLAVRLQCSVRRIERAVQNLDDEDLLRVAGKALRLGPLY